MRPEEPERSREAESRASREAKDGAIRFQRPQLPSDSEIGRYFALAREERWFSNGGPCHRLLSERIASFLGRDLEVVLVANATLGLMLALRSLVGDTPAGSRVIVPSFTFPATAQAISWNGLRPIWVDVEPRGWHLDPDALTDALTEHGDEVAAVLACSTFGTAPGSSQVRAWQTACERASVPLLIDSAAGFGSSDEHGDLLGGNGDAEVFSFHATKPFGIGEGGAVVTRDRELARRLSAMTNFAFDEQRSIESPFGLNAKMSELHAATGLALLDNFDDVLLQRRTAAESLRASLESAGYVFQAGAEHSSWQFVPVLAPTVEVRASVIAAASERAIEVRAYHEPLHTMRAFAGVSLAQSGLPETDELAARALSLPLANDLSAREVSRIAELLLDCVGSPAEQVTP